MNKKIFCELIQANMKEIRTEYSLTQEVMATTIGISKKTLVQLEKKRIDLKWTEAVAVVSIFNDSSLLIEKLGGDSSEIIQAIALQKAPTRQFITLGGEVWWEEIDVKNGFVMQQHKLSKHYRILDQDNFRIYFSFSYKDTFKAFNKYSGKINSK